MLRTILAAILCVLANSVASAAALPLPSPLGDDPSLRCVYQNLLPIGATGEEIEFVAIACSTRNEFSLINGGRSIDMLTLEDHEGNDVPFEIVAADFFISSFGALYSLRVKAEDTGLDLPFETVNWTATATGPGVEISETFLVPEPARLDLAAVISLGIVAAFYRRFPQSETR